MTPTAQGRLSGRGPVLFILGVLAVVVLGLLLRPFLPAIVIAGVAATLARPAQNRLTARLGKPSLAAFLITLGIVLLFLLPMVGLSFLVGRQAAVGIEWLSQEAPNLRSGRFASGLLGNLAARFGVSPSNLSALLASQLQNLASVLAGRTLSFLTGIGGWLLQGGAALFALYYLLRDSDALVRSLRWLVPLEDDETDKLFTRAREVIFATVYGSLLVAAVQGTLGGLAFRLAGLPAATLWGTLMGVLSLVPAVGPPLIWIPGAAYLIMTGAVARGIFVALVGALVIGTIDNVLRATLVSGKAQLHPLIVFFSVLGGIFVFGAPGVIVGPVAFVLALAVLEMARLALDPPGSGGAPPGEGPVMEAATEEVE